MAAGGSTLVQPSAGSAVEERREVIAESAAFGDALNQHKERVPVSHSSFARERGEDRLDGPVVLVIVEHPPHVARARPYQSPRGVDTIEEHTSPSLKGNPTAPIPAGLSLTPVQASGGGVRRTVARRQEGKQPRT